MAGLPLSDWNSSLYVRINGAPPPAPGESVSAGYSQASPGYFQTMKIPLLQGRDFTEQDRTYTPQVVIVDETFVKHFKLGTNVFGGGFSSATAPTMPRSSAWSKTSSTRGSRRRHAVKCIGPTSRSVGDFWI